MSELVGGARKLSPSAQEALRLRAVAALVAGRAREDVAAVFQVSLKAVDDWWAKWPGMRARGARSSAAWTPGRQAVDQCPCDLGAEAAVDAGRSGDLIARLYRVRLTEQGVGKYLRRWGLSFQRLDKRRLLVVPAVAAVELNRARL
ncbi:winged helix-turn-helix domain-containing protein [Streptomyces xiangluensis]|uniref:winged helix-turn-helix domain-containing protein n=1 Tax=Streptomyces xiangluensis TaxID=2665720 RepID=UPI003AA9BA9A